MMAFISCYEQHSAKSKSNIETINSNIKQCMEKWMNIYEYIGSSEMFDKYRTFVEKERKQKA